MIAGPHKPWSHLVTRWLALVLSGMFFISLGACLVQPANTDLDLQVTKATNANQDQSVTLALLGDVMLGRGVKPSHDTFAYLEPYLQSADLSLANLESPLTNAAPQANSPYNLCADPQNITYLAEAGFDLLSLANNHHLDCGQAGLDETKRTLTKAGLGYIGPEAKPAMREVHGLQLAFLAFDATTDFDLAAAEKTVTAARKTAEIVIVALHWGAEYQSGSTPEQERIAKRLASAGAALIWGQHPHVLQPATHINTSLVLYSLGNALFDQGGLKSTRLSALVMVTLDGTGVRSMKAIPFMIDVRGSRIVQPDPDDTAAILEYFK